MVKKPTDFKDPVEIDLVDTFSELSTSEQAKKGDLVQFGQEQSPPASPERGGLRKLLPLLRRIRSRINPALGLADLAVSNYPSEEEFKRRSEKVASESRSGLQTIIDLAKGKNPNVSRRDVLKGIKTAGQMAATPNLPVDFSPSETPSSLPLPILDKKDIIKEGIKALSKSKLGNYIQTNMKYEGLPEHKQKRLPITQDSGIEALADSIFDFSTGSGLHHPNREYSDWMEQLMYRDGVTLDNITHKNIDPYIKEYKDSKEGLSEDTWMGHQQRVSMAMDGDWENLKDYINYYNVDTDIEGTWKNFVEIAEKFKNSSDYEKNFKGPGIKRDLKAAWKKLKWSERDARDTMEKWLHDYFQNYKGVDPGIMLDLDDKEFYTGSYGGYQKFSNLKERAEALKERARITEERYKELIGERGDQEIRTGSRKSDVKKLKDLSKEEIIERFQAKYGTPTYHRSFLETSTGKQDKYLGDHMYQSQLSGGEFGMPELEDVKDNNDEQEVTSQPEGFYKKSPTYSRKKYSGGVIRNPYSYAPRDI